MGGFTALAGWVRAREGRGGQRGLLQRRTTAQVAGRRPLREATRRLGHRQGHHRVRLVIFADQKSFLPVHRGPDVGVRGVPQGEPHDLKAAGRMRRGGVRHGKFVHVNHPESHPGRRRRGHRRAGRAQGSHPQRRAGQGDRGHVRGGGGDGRGERAEPRGGPGSVQAMQIRRLRLHHRRRRASRRGDPAGFGGARGAGCETRDPGGREEAGYPRR